MTPPVDDGVDPADGRGDERRGHDQQQQPDGGQIRHGFTHISPRSGSVRIGDLENARPVESWFAGGFGVAFVRNLTGPTSAQRRRQRTNSRRTLVFGRQATPRRLSSGSSNSSPTRSSSMRVDRRSLADGHVATPRRAASAQPRRRRQKIGCPRDHQRAPDRIGAYVAGVPEPGAGSNWGGFCLLMAPRGVFDVTAPNYGIWRRRQR